MNDYFRLHGKLELNKREDIITKVKTLVDEEYANGLTSLLGDDELVVQEDLEFYESLAHFHKRKKGN